MPTPRRSPLDFYLVEQHALDAEIRKLLRDAAELAQRQIQYMVGKTNISSQVRRAQLRIIQSALTKIQHDLWTDIGSATHRQVVKSVEAGFQAERWMASDLLKYLPQNIREAFVKQQRVAAVRIANLYIRRGISGSGTGHSLSQRVYRSEKLAGGQVERLVRQHILIGSSARDLARDVKSSIRPDSPGGTSYSAMRLARTELNNAFHLAQVDAQKENPAAIGAVWHLSDQHPEPDECNEYADQNKYALGDGVFPVGQVPRKPHPNCLCFRTTKLPDREEFIARMRAELGKT